MSTFNRAEIERLRDREHLSANPSCWEAAEGFDVCLDEIDRQACERRVLANDHVITFAVEATYYLKRTAQAEAQARQLRDLVARAVSFQLAACQDWLRDAHKVLAKTESLLETEG